MSESNINAILSGATGATGTGTLIGTSIASAASTGAGSLAGYAGMAHAVSTMGLGAATKAGAVMLGSSASGAAATATVIATLHPHTPRIPHTQTKENVYVAHFIAVPAGGLIPLTGQSGTLLRGLPRGM